MLSFFSAVFSAGKHFAGKDPPSFCCCSNSKDLKTRRTHESWALNHSMKLTFESKIYYTHTPFQEKIE